MTDALTGLRVLDLTQYEAGTSATQTLAWLGADVVKLEQPVLGDPGRGRATTNEDRWYFLTLNGNKRSIALDLKKPDGHALFLKLLPKFDVVAENLGPGTVESLGVGYDDLKQHHPGLIFATIKGFGSTGPYASYKSYDMVAQAVGGSMSITGRPDTEPFRSGATYGDTGTGMKLAIGILAAYIKRLRTGEGSHVEVSMQDAIASYSRVGFLARETKGDPVPRVGNNLSQLTPTDTYPCKPFGPNDYVYVVAVTGRMFENLLIAIGRPELVDDPRLRTAEGRQESSEWLKGLVRDWAAVRTKHEAMRDLQQYGIPTGAVFGSDDIFNDPHLRERGMVQDVEHPTRGTVETLGNPIRIDQTPSQLKAAPLLGEHTDSLLSEELGLSQSDIEELRSAGVLGESVEVPMAGSQES